MPEKHSTRREFLKNTALAATAAALPGCADAMRTLSRKTSTPPNVLFIICDDLNDSVAGMGGHPQAITPNINRLMRRGVRFTNAQSNNPICAPSRASLLHGIYPHTSGFYGYHQNRRAPFYEYKIFQDCVTFPEYFKKNGYTVFGTGKLHHWPQPQEWVGLDGVARYGHRIDYGPWPWDGKSDKPLPNPNLPAPLNERQWDGFGPLSDTPIFGGVRGGWRKYAGREDTDDKSPFRYVNDDDRDLMADEKIAAWAADVLSQKHNAPFFLAVGFGKPHAPFYAPQKYFDMFPLETIQLPPYKLDDLADCAKILAEKTSPDDWGRSVWDAVQEAGGEQMWKRWVQAYLACVAYVDEQTGKVLDALEASPYADNTIVVFTSDHGYHMGEKDHMFKNTDWEETTRTPLVIFAPGLTQADAECDHPVSLVDLYPTLVDLAGLPDKPNRASNQVLLDGHSLRPFLKDPKNGTWDGPDVALTVVAGGDKLEFHEPGKVERQHFTVRSRDWRYILCGNGEEELYDHRVDPHEWTNLAADPRYASIKAQLRHQLLQLTGRVSRAARLECVKPNTE